MDRKTMERAHEEAAQWTEAHPVGTPMQYQPIKGEDVWEDVTVRSVAWPLGWGGVVAKVTGRTGGVLVSHLRRPPSQEDDRG